ncbi:MAG: DNA gyrase subunit A, partial [Clostridia bacterium]
TISEINGVVSKIENENGKDMIVVTEIPYQINKSVLLKNISLLRETKKEIFGCISEIVDESDRMGMRCVIKLRKDTDAKFILNALYKTTNLECGFSANIVAIAEGRPQQLTLLEIIKFYVDYQREIIYKRSQYDLVAAKKRAHILEGLLIAVHNIREVVEIVLTSKTYVESKDRLKSSFELSEKQAVAVLDVPLKRLNKLDIGKMEEELAELDKLIKELESVLASKKKQLAIVRQEILEIKRKYNEPRKSRILNERDSQEIVVDLTAQMDRNGMVVLNHNGNVKYLSEKNYKQSLKSIVNCTAQTLVKRVIKADNKSNVIAFTKKGSAIVFALDGFDDDKWKSRGNSASDLGKVDADDDIVEIMLADKNFDNKKLVFYTTDGMIKKS